MHKASGWGWSFTNHPVAVWFRERLFKCSVSTYVGWVNSHVSFLKVVRQVDVSPVNLQVQSLPKSKLWLAVVTCLPTVPQGPINTECLLTGCWDEWVPVTRYGCPGKSERQESEYMYFTALHTRDRASLWRHAIALMNKHPWASVPLTITELS